MAESKMTVGQVVDQVADQYFVSGCDAFTSNVRALMDVLCAFQNADMCLKAFLKAVHRDPEVEHEG